MIEDVDATFATLRPKAGDIIVVRSSERLSPEIAGHLRDTLASRLPTGVQLWLMDPSMELTHIEAP